MLFQAISKGGKSLYGKADYDNLQLFDGVLGYSGLGDFSHQDLQKALSGSRLLSTVLCRTSIRCCQVHVFQRI